MAIAGVTRSLLPLLTMPPNAGCGHAMPWSAMVQVAQEPSSDDGKKAPHLWCQDCQGTLWVCKIKTQSKNIQDKAGTASLQQHGRPIFRPCSRHGNRVCYEFERLGLESQLIPKGNPPQRRNAWQFEVSLGWGYLFERTLGPMLLQVSAGLHDMFDTRIGSVRRFQKNEREWELALLSFLMLTLGPPNTQLRGVLGN